MAPKAEKVIEVIEPVVEDVVEVVETLERIPKLRLNGTTRQQQILILSFVAAGAAAAGAGAAMVFFKKRYQAKYEQLATDEIAEAKQFYRTMQKPPMEELLETTGLSQSLVDAGEAMASYQGVKLPYAKPEALADALPIESEVTQNIFVDGAPVKEDFDYEAEIAQRSSDSPYIISKEEFNQGEQDYTQAEVTYFQEDDTLADDKGKEIPDSDEAVGDINLQKFGHGSGDNNVLYVRNEQMEIDFTILRSNGSFAKEVLGLRHSDMTRGGSRKTRRADWGDDG